MARKVFFQKTRLFFFGIGQSFKFGRARDPALKDAHKELVRLSEECIRACEKGQQDMMIAKLDVLLEQGKKKEYESIINGTHPDVPEWWDKRK